MNRVVKVQVPLFSTEESPGCLVYDAGQRRIAQQPVTPAVMRALNGDYKGYFRATWDSRKRVWDIGERVEDRDW